MNLGLTIRPQVEPFREISKLFDRVLLSLRVVRACGPGPLGFVAVLSVSGAVLAVASALALAKAVDAAAQDLADLRVWIIVFAGVTAAQGVWNGAVAAASPRLQRSVDERFQRRLMESIDTPEQLYFATEPDVRAAVEQVRNGIPSAGITPGTIAALLPAVIADRLRSIGFVVGLWFVAWPVGLAFLLLLPLNQEAMQRAMWRVVGVSAFAPPPEVQYIVEIATDLAVAKEVRLFGMSRWLERRYRTAMTGFLEAAWSQRREFSTGLAALLVIDTLVAALAVVLLGFGLRDGDVSIGATSFALIAIMNLTPRFSLEDLPFAFASDIAVSLSKLEDSLGTRRTTAEIATRVAKDSVSNDRPPSIVFDDVSFTYPGESEAALSRVSLEASPGSLSAVVGANGSGKTTLFRLITGMFYPTTGQLLINGRPIDDIDLIEWRSRMSVMLQRFTRFEMNVYDSVVLGCNVSDWREDEGTREAIEDAIERAGLSSRVARLTAGGHTDLAVSAAGDALSGGEWQRLALARVFFAANKRATLTLLDEPTAHLDALGELQVEQAIDGWRRAKTQVVISHRLSLARRAQNIYVLDKGRISERGSHEELLSLGGIYASMHEGQAAVFRGPGKSA